MTKAHIEEAQQKYIRQHREELNFSRALEEGPLLGQKNVGGGVLPDFYLIPAERDLTDEIKVKTTTTFGRLLNPAVSEMADRDPCFREARRQLEEVLQSLNLRDYKVNIQVTPPELEGLFELDTDGHLDGGVKTTADRKGHGLQRAMMFALLRAFGRRSWWQLSPSTLPKKEAASANVSRSCSKVMIPTKGKGGSIWLNG